MFNNSGLSLVRRAVVALTAWPVLVLATIAGVTGWSILAHGSLGGAFAYLVGDVLMVDSPVKSVGTVGLGRQSVAVFHVANVTKEPVTIIGAQTSCGCAVIENLPLVVRPHQTVALSFSVVVSRSQRGAKFQEQARLYLDTPSNPVFLTVAGCLQENPKEEREELAASRLPNE